MPRKVYEPGFQTLLVPLGMHTPEPSDRSNGLPGPRFVYWPGVEDFVGLLSEFKRAPQYELSYLEPPAGPRPQTSGP